MPEKVHRNSQIEVELISCYDLDFLPGEAPTVPRLIARLHCNRGGSVESVFTSQI